MDESPIEWDETELQDLPEEVKRCAESVKESNPDLDKSAAIAICRDMNQKGQLSLREATALNQPIRALATDHPMDPPGPIERAETDEGIRYSNILILAPGEWTDGGTGETLFYSPDLTEHIAADPRERVPERNGRRQNIVNFDHAKGESLKEVGHFDVDSLARDGHGNLYADIVLWNDTQTSQDAVALMDRALKTDGQQGAGGFSVEIPFENERIEFDSDRGMEAMLEGDLAGLAISPESASAPAATAQQFADRATALSAERTYASTLKAASRPGGRMEVESTDDLRRALDVATDEGEPTVEIEIDGSNIEEIKDALGADEEDEPGDEAESESEAEEEEEEAETSNLDDEPEPEHELQDMGAVADALQTYLGEVEGETTVAEFVSWAADQEDVDAEAVEDVVGIFMQEADAEDPAEVDAGMLMQFIEEQAGDGDEEEEQEEMSETLEAVKEELRELRDEKEDLETRLSAIEEESREPKSRAAHATAPNGGETPSPRPSKGGFSVDSDGWTTR